MTFVEKYRVLTSWQDKATLMSLYHSVAMKLHPNWTLKKTATVFEVSVGLVSENIRLANEIDNGSTIALCATRQEALNKIDRRKEWRD